MYFHVFRKNGKSENNDLEFLSNRVSPNVHNYPDMEAVPLLLNNVKGEPPEDSLPVDHFQTQTEPVDLSINKARTSPTAVSSSPVSMTASASSPSSTSTSSSSSSRPASSPTVITSVSSASSSSTVLSPGPLVASASGVGGQQFLHIIHPVPPSSPMNLQSNKLSHVHRIPVVVQSVPVVYTAVRSPGNVNNTIVVPLLEDGRSHGKGKRHKRLDTMLESDFPNIAFFSPSLFNKVKNLLIQEFQFALKERCVWWGEGGGKIAISLTCNYRKLLSQSSFLSVEK
ncbi:Klf12 [Phodopus roborovskii]|uniref:Klf12 protein n=1 Tax=Phodopus roborovskii TaxID=109678 RepID=A0AAU9ZPE8_PHORO|nr:Klf12 [Phodopus roborovskii]